MRSGTSGTSRLRAVLPYRSVDLLKLARWFPAACLHHWSMLVARLLQLHRSIRVTSAMEAGITGHVWDLGAIGVELSTCASRNTSLQFSAILVRIRTRSNLGITSRTQSTPRFQ